MIQNELYPARLEFFWSASARLVSVLIVAVTISLALRAEAHSDLEEQIGQITEQLPDHAESSELLLQRAELYRRHTQFDEALRDIAAAQRKIPPARITLARAKVFSDAGRAEKVLDAAQQFLTMETNQSKSPIEFYPGGKTADKLPASLLIDKLALRFNANTSTLRGGDTFFDNASISAVAEPTAGALFGLVIFGMILRRRRG